MASTLKLPVGIENFEEIRKLGFYYIDKTRLIERKRCIIARFVATNFS